MGDWSGWSSCSRSCNFGESRRKRNVLERNQHGGISCPVLNGTKSCNDFHCPVDCQVSQVSNLQKKKVLGEFLDHLEFLFKVL